MPDLHHVYLSIHGEWTSTAWLGESAQVGLRLPFAYVTGGPAKGSIWTPEANGEVVADTGVTAGSNGQLARTWTARIGASGSGENWDDAAQVDAAEDVYTFLNAIKAYYYSGFRFTHVKQAAIDPNGNFAGKASVYSFTTPLAGTGTAVAPPQIACALSFRAPVMGRRGRGRMYLPAITQSQIGSDGTVASTMRTVVIGHLQTLVNDLQNVPGLSTYQPILSVLSPGSPTAVRPSELRIGDRWDTQTRRRQQVPEAYTVQAL